MRSIRRAFVLRGIAATAVMFAIVAIATYVAVDRILVFQLDDSLQQESRLFASLLEAGAEGLEFGIEDLDMEDFEDDPPVAYLWVEQEGGELIYPSDESDIDPSTFPPELIETLDDVPRWISIDGRRVRAIATVVEPRADTQDADDEVFEVDPDDLRPVSLALARSDPDRADFLSSFSVSYAVVLLVALLVLSVLLGAIATSSLRSLRLLADRIEQTPADGTAERIELEGVPVEVAPLVERLNALLERVGEAVNREKSFSADIAHELRTPLAGLRAVIEVALHRDRNAGEYREALVDAMNVVRQTEAMADRLLELNRLDTGAFALDRAVLDLSSVVRERWALLAPAVERKNVSVAVELGQEVPVRSDPALLGALVINLLDNAVSHVESGGSIRIDTRSEGEGGVFLVVNTGSRVSPDDVARLFDRFSRGDPARAATGRHVGLGLAVAKRIAEVLGAELRVESQVDGEFSAEVRLPGPAMAPD